MGKRIAMVVALLLSGCDAAQPPMTNAQIIAATKQCTDVHLRAEVIRYIGDPRIIQIQCNPEKTP